MQKNYTYKDYVTLVHLTPNGDMQWAGGPGAALWPEAWFDDNMNRGPGECYTTRLPEYLKTVLMSDLDIGPDDELPEQIKLAVEGYRDHTVILKITPNRTLFATEVTLPDDTYLLFVDNHNGSYEYQLTLPRIMHAINGYTSIYTSGRADETYIFTEDEQLKLVTKLATIIPIDTTCVSQRSVAVIDTEKLTVEKLEAALAAIPDSKYDEGDIRFNLDVLTMFEALEAPNYGSDNA